MLASQARYVAVMDADLQHDDKPCLFLARSGFARGRADVAVASRYLDGGSPNSWTVETALACQSRLERIGSSACSVIELDL